LALTLIGVMALGTSAVRADENAPGASAPAPAKKPREAVSQAILGRVDDKLGDAAERARLRHQLEQQNPEGIVGRVDDKAGDARQRAWLDWPLRDARLVRVMDRRGDQRERDQVRERHLIDAITNLTARKFPKGTESAAHTTGNPESEREIERRRDVRPSSTDSTDQHKAERDTERGDEKRFLRDESWRERRERDLERRDEKSAEKNAEKKDDKAEQKKEKDAEKKSEKDAEKKDAKSEAKVEAAKERAEDRKDRRDEVKTSDERLTKQQP
jgi:hypothetical protein